MFTDNKRNVAAEGGIVAVYYGGTLIGALIAGSLADRMGRIKAVVTGSLFALLGAVLQASAYNITWMCCARVIAGLGVGAIDCVIPVWSAEVSSHQARGAFLAIEFFMVCRERLAGSQLMFSHPAGNTRFRLHRTCLYDGPQTDFRIEHRWSRPGILDRILRLSQSQQSHGMAYTFSTTDHIHSSHRLLHQFLPGIPALAHENGP